MDASNSVVQLCVDGMSAESEGRVADAKALFERAWNASSDDFERCIAAHYVARHQATAEAELQWNEEALRRADAVADGRVRTFYASLYLNVAHSLEQTGRSAEACRHYALAAERLTELPPSPYANLVRIGVEAGRGRTCCADHTAPSSP
jgi:hypothetical protein